MKVLWITNIPIGEMANRMGSTSSGLWMDVMLRAFQEKKEHQIAVATIGDVCQIEHFCHEDVSYYRLPGTNQRGSLLKYRDTPEHIAQWKQVIQQEQPDLMMLWGSEFMHGFTALEAAPEVPAVVYVQGLLESIARHYDVGLRKREINRSMTLRSFLLQDGVYSAQNQYWTRVCGERKIFQHAGHAICENMWCESYIKRIAPDSVIHHLPLDINDCFRREERSKNVEAHSIICNAVGYPIKGLHITLKALAILKERYPDVKLYIPGSGAIDPELPFLKMMKKTDYYRYCARLIKELKLESHIVWLGRLNQEDLAKQLATKNAFVLSSSIENHSGSLKEAMMVGLPCVASFVGGVPEYVRQGENGFLYQSGEYEMMAHWISTLFENEQLSQRIGTNARKDMLTLHANRDNYADMVSIMEKIVDTHGKAME